MTVAPPSAGPLGGLVVADFSRILAGPYATMLLADMGAEVVKVEGPTGLPKGLEPGQVRLLLASCDRRTPTGLRDYAIMLLLGRLGLRAGEVARLDLDDVDWRHGEIDRPFDLRSTPLRL